MARARATARHPQGWSDMVEQLAAAPDRPAFLDRMLALQCKVVAAEYGAIWTLGEDGRPAVACAWVSSTTRANDKASPTSRRQVRGVLLSITLRSASDSYS